MAACAACGSTILFGGKAIGDVKFCNGRCQSKGSLVILARQLPPDLVKQRTWSVYQGACPKCHGAGPVDVHVSHQIWSVLILTSWKNTPQVSCKSCGVKSQLGDTAFSLLLGWWGFPWGLIITPVQIVRNIVGMTRGASADGPSASLERIVGLMLAAEMAQRSQGAGQVQAT
jgi:DNA-directed RNA polymerase subunit RPC12/RpoP